MKIELDISDEWVQRVVALWTKDTLDMIEKFDLIHPDDVKYNERLVKALKVVLDYMGEGNEET